MNASTDNQTQDNTGLITQQLEFSEESRTKFRQIREIVSKCAIDANPVDELEQQVMVGRAIGLLRKLLDGEILEQLMALKGSPIGWRTDRDDPTCKLPPYDQELLRDVLIEGILSGGRTSNNEINVIASGCFLTGNYYDRKLRELEGFANLRKNMALPELCGPFALVAATATWSYHGRQDSIEFLKGPAMDTRISVKLNNGQGHDQATGKAERKLLKAIWERVTGRVVDSDDDSIPEDALDVTPEPKIIDAVAERSVKIRDKLIDRITDAVTIADLERIKVDAHCAVEEGSLTHKDSRTVGENLNNMYRHINKLDQPKQEQA